MILGIPDDFIVTEKDINKKVVDQYRREQMETRKKSLKLKDGTTHDPAAMFDHEKSRPQSSTANDYAARDQIVDRIVG